MLAGLTPMITMLHLWHRNWLACGWAAAAIFSRHPP